MTEYMRHRRSEGGNGFFCRFTFGQFFALLVLEVFTLFFVFYLGARYGQDFLGLKQEVSAVEQEATEEGADAKVLTTADPETVKIAPQLIEKAKTPELKDRIRRMIEGAQKPSRRRMPEVVSVNRREESAPAVAKAPKKVPDVVSSEEGTKEAPQPSPEKPIEDTGVVRVKSPSGARYSVQVGSYPQMSEAAQAVERWKKKGYPAFMMIADIPDRGRWYRVRLGGFKTREDATYYMKELQARENVEALVVLNEQ